MPKTISDEDMESLNEILSTRWSEIYMTRIEYSHNLEADKKRNEESKKEVNRILGLDLW